MCTVKAFLYLLIVSVAATSEKDHETMCKNDYRDLENNHIVLSKYCSNKLCIEKCCRKDEILVGPFCVNKTDLFKNKKNSHLESKVNYSTNILSSWYKNENSKKNFVLVHNQRDLKCTSEHNINEEYEILQDGSLSLQDTDTKKWSTLERLTYCYDYYVSVKKNNNETEFSVKIIIREVNEDSKDREMIAIFETIGVSISSFFLLLVLIVYCLLPELRNLSGLVLMAYTFSLLFAFITKLVVNFNIKTAPPGFCKRITPILYYAFLSSIFWLSVISFDVWSGIRRFRIKRGSKREELIRFMWYGLYACGSPLVITAIVTTLDNVDISYWGIEKPPFDECFHDNGAPFNYYFRIPIGILIIINIVLFVVTIYHIWIVKYAVKNSNSSKQQNTKFSTYAKLSLMMGVNWCMELFENQHNILWLYILINIYNIFTGVTIFYLFVWNKKNLVLLCKKFNIRNEFVKNLDAELSQRSKSVNTKSTFASRSTVKSKTMGQNQGPDVVQNCATEEITLV